MSTATAKRQYIVLSKLRCLFAVAVDIVTPKKLGLCVWVGLYVGVGVTLPILTKRV